MAVSITKKTAGEKVPQKIGLHFIQKVIKEDTFMVMAGSQALPEDKFVGLYWDPQNTERQFLEPPFNPEVLRNYANHNNTLNQCIEAMEVNIDGTGYELVPIEDGKTIEEAEKKKIESFLKEPYPNESMVSIRRAWRRPYESVGWQPLEVLRNVGGDIIGLRNVSFSDPIRFVRLDAPIRVKRKIQRNGQEIELEYWDRERRFAQKIGPGTEVGAYVYYREFGTTRHCHRTTGEWETKEKPIKPEDRASELLMFRLNPDVGTPYGLPRWINQLPSVIGSRKAEELNLEFFDSGGMPPAIIFIEGGTMATDMADQLRQYLSGQMKNRNRAVVVETQSTSGSLDSQGKTGVKVERFGAEATKDSMFKEYDKSTEEHVRVGFRLPPLFIGRADDYNYASAVVSYMVAEAQVFGPEREEFDEVFNRTIMKGLGATSCKFKSKPITLRDMDMQIKALGMVSTMVDPETFVKEVNKLTGLSLEAKEPEDIEGQAQAEADRAWDEREHSTELQGKLIETQEKMKAKYAKVPVQKLAALAHDWLRAEKILPTKWEHTESELETIRKSVDSLSKHDRSVFDKIVSVHVNKALVTGEVGESIAA